MKFESFISDLADQAKSWQSFESEALRLSDAVFVEPRFFRVKARLANIIEHWLVAELRDRVRRDLAIKASGFDPEDVKKVSLAMLDQGDYVFIITKKDGTEARVRVPVGDVVAGKSA